jgi:hypothetical protein
MIFIKLRRKVLAQANQSNGGDETKDLFWKVPLRVKVMTMLKATEKVKRESQKRASQCSLFIKQGSSISNLIRIQLEETKGKVRFHSPAALRFIGPGDR